MTTTAEKVTVRKNTKPNKESKLDILDEMMGDLPIFTEEDYVTSTTVFPSGSVALDLAIGIGGYPSGCILDVYGGPSAGKSLLSIMYAAQVQQAGGSVVVWDVERSYSKNLSWLKVNGVDTKKLRFIKLGDKQGCEIGMDAVEQIARAGAADLIIVDSIPAMVPQAGLERSMTEHQIVAERANKLTTHLARLVGICDNSKTSVMFINQIRANMGGGMYESKEKETSIFAMKHYASLRLDVTKLSGKKYRKEANGVPVGHRVRVKVEKNKLAAPYRQAEFDILYTEGVDKASEIADILIAAKAAEKKGAWVYYDGDKFQGMDKFIEAFRDPKMFEKGLKKARSLSSKVNAFGVGARDDDAALDDGSLRVGE
jgi:recombination protein RecA